MVIAGGFYAGLFVVFYTSNAPAEARCTSHPADYFDGNDAAPEFEPCDVCGGTEADFDGFCPQCELPMEIKA